MLLRGLIAQATTPKCNVCESQVNTKSLTRKLSYAFIDTCKTKHGTHPTQACEIGKIYRLVKYTSDFNIFEHKR